MADSSDRPPGPDHMSGRASASVPTRRPPAGRTARLNRWLRRRAYLLMLAPALILYLSFIVYPFLTSMYYGLYNWSGIGPLSDYVGLANFQYILTSPEFAPRFFTAVLHNLWFFAILTVLTVGMGVVIAHLLTRVSHRSSRPYQVIYFLPYVMPPVVVGWFVDVYLQPGFGVIPTLAAKLHVEFLDQPYLGQISTALPTIAVVTVWSTIGFAVIILLATLVGLPGEVLEAARVDGASDLQSFLHIVVPLVRPTIITICTLNLINSFNIFDLIYVLEGPLAGPNYGTDVTGTLFYRTAFGGGFDTASINLGLASAMATISFILVMVVSGLLVSLQRHYSVEY
jgi:raffinose/stachyose/melibiose transport system permease protein